VRSVERLGLLSIAAWWLLLPAGTSASDVKSPPNSASFRTSVQPFLARNCYGCHNAELLSGGLNLEAFTTAASVAQDRDHWEHVLEKVKSGQMPPKGVPRPDQAEAKAVTDWVAAELDRLDRAAPPDPGRVTARRLNRAEYDLTVRDLLGVNFRPADDFPQDDSGYGFDNIGDVLSLSVVQMEKYLQAAETVARTAVYGPQSAKATMIRVQPPLRRRPGDPDQLIFTTHPYYTLTNYDESGLSMPNTFHVQHTFPATGEYVFRMTPDNGSRPPGSEPLEMAAWIDGKLAFTTSVDGQLEGKAQEFRAMVTEGDHWLAFGFPRQFEGLPVAYAARNPSKRPVPAGRGRGGFQQLPPNATPEQVAAFEARRAAFLAGSPGGAGPAAGAGGRGGAGRGGRGNNAANNNDDANDVAFTVNGVRLSRPDNMRIQFVDIGGPDHPEIKPSAGQLHKIYVCGHYDGSHQPGCDRKIVSNLARLAYRRPVTRPEIDELMAQIARVRERGDSFEEQIVMAIQAMLVSPNFLFRIEKDRGPQRAAASGAYPLNDYELASRLSYFLWSSMPDEELLRAADRGSLQKSEVLTAQAGRMLKDPKISGLVENFGGQWLQIRALESHVPDFYLFPQYDSYLRMSMERETGMFFENLIHEDRSILEFLDADYTFVNEYLAQFYRIAGVTGPEFRKVSLAGTPRRGLLGQAGILTVSSYPDRTSVVLRGKWVLENLLNMAPPPPPPGIPDLADAKVPEGATLRQRMEVHRTDAVCASCHVRMDPIGFSLENYNAIGQWREKDGKNPVDASGTLPDGRSFRGPIELAAILKSDGDAFAQCLAEKMLTYALGRGLESYDKPVVKRIAGQVAANHYRFSTLVLEIVKSLPFQMRRGDAKKS